MASVKVVDGTGKDAGTLELKPEVFGAEARVPLLHQAVVRELADRRVGTHDTKGRSEVSGGGKKPWRQKGTGRARQGSIRATQWKGGGKPFGPTPRSYAKAMPQAMRRAALRDAVAAKVAAGEVRVIETLDEWLRRRLRCLLWRQWKRPRHRARQLRQRGLDEDRAWRSALNGRGPWWNAGAPHMNAALPTAFFTCMGLASLVVTHQRLQRVR